MASNATSTATALLLAAAIATPSLAQEDPFRCARPDPPATVTDEGATADALVERMAELGAFSGSVLMMRGDRVLVHGGYGLASETPCVLAGPETVYHVGSLGKQFAATAALLLEDRRRWSVQDPISRFLPDAPPDKASITLHQLLTHTSGLPADIVGYGAERRPMPRDTLLARILRAPLVTEPGAAYRYSNAGYSLLTILIERVAAEPYTRFVRREFFQPAGLRRTAFVGDRERLRGLTVADGFWGRYGVPAPDRTPSWAIMPGEVLSTVGDLARWYLALEAGRILSPGSLSRMLTPHASDYGYGWHVRTRDDGSVAVIFHNGDQGQHGTAFRHYPRSDLIAVAATNLVLQDAKQHDDVLNNALEVLAGESVELPARSGGAAGEAEPDPGVYRDGTSAFRLTRDPAGALWLAPLTGDAFRALRGGAPELDARAADALRRTASFEDSLLTAGRACPASRRAPDEDWPRQYVGGWNRLPCDLAEELGPHIETVSVGARPLSWSRSRTFVFRRHVHARGSRVVTWLWDGERPVEAWQSSGTDFPQSVRLARTAEGFGVFDWFTGTLLPVRFERGPGGAREIRIERDEQGQEERAEHEPRREGL